MIRSLLAKKFVVPVVLCFQVIPLIVFPPSSYSLQTQEWWLPLFLCILVVVSLVQVLVRKSVAAWPWYLFSFAQGFNIISRIMMFFPHATINDQGTMVFNAIYVWISLAAMVLSAFEIWYCDLPEVRARLVA